MPRPSRSAVLATALLPLAAQPTSSDAALPTYTVTDLGNLGDRINEVSGINNKGQVIGAAYLPGSVVVVPFLWSNGTMTSLGSLGGTFAEAYAINDAGYVVGESRTLGTSGERAYLRTSGPLMNLGTFPGGNESRAFGINSAGQVVGDSTAADGRYHAFLYTGTGPMIDLGIPPDATDSTAHDINDSGLIVGEISVSPAFHAAIFASGSVLDLHTFPGMDRSSARSVNSSGQVVGFFAGTYENPHGFLYSQGVMTDLGAMPDGNGLVPSSINDAGDIVGQAHNGGVLSIAGSPFVYLNTLLAPSPVAWSVTDAVAINNLGQIAAEGTRPDQPGRHALLLTPIPEPGTLFLLATDYFLLSTLRSRRPLIVNR